MALKALLMRNKINAKKKLLEELRKKDDDFSKREKELETAIGEMDESTSEEDRKVVDDQVAEFEEEKETHEKEKKKLEEEIDGLEQELTEIEKENNPVNDKGQDTRKEEKVDKMKRRTIFFGMGIQERDAFFADESVKHFLERTREIANEKRTVKGAELTIPDIVLDLIRENITQYSKLVGRVRLRPVTGKARQNVMGTVPEAVWTEMCARLNELSLSFSQTEVDGYKVAGIIYICSATLEDSDYNLAVEIISALGQAIGIALDKAILYGVGTKMPLGIVTRLAQSSEPDNYPANARPWEDLQGNLITIDSGKTGLEFFKEIVAAGGKAKSKYAQGGKFWAMNETTLTKIKIESMNFAASGAIYAINDNKMPVAGGDIVVLSDDVIADNNIVAGYGELYLLAERSGSQFARSDEYLFADDMVAFKGSARYDGTPVIAEGFIAIGLGSAPVKSVTFVGDTANDASLQELTIGTETLSPSFDSKKYDYEITATGDSGVVNAVSSQNNAKIEIEYNGKKVNNGTEIKFITDAAGKPLVITVKNGLGESKYTVNIKKAGA